RTAAEGKKVADLHEEINTLMEKWAAMYEQLRGARQPKKLLSELDKTSSMLRDILNDDFSKIVIDDEDTFNSVKSYLHTFAPERTKIMSLHRGSKPIFDAYSVMKQIKSAFGKTATMNSGAYLVIESTEAMHVIDVNSGPKMAKNANDDAIYNINLEAAEEIARQLRLRDIGGLICIDFIDMKSSDHRRDLVNKMRDLMSSDRAQHTILPLSKFGLMEITRERVKPEVKINTAEVCPSCNGTGKVNPTILLTDDIERDIEFILNNRPMKHLHLHTHPYVFAFIKKGLPNLQMRWYLRFKKWIKVYQNGDFHINQYKFYDGLDDEIRLS
ncbi:MAG: ribonuclease E/G, partial [Saprospiraceae bacterium]